MACFHPLRAFRSRAGEVVLGKEVTDSAPLSLPCGGCLGCRKARAREWALRCHLELQSHQSAVFTTLTYSDDNLPEFNSLEKRDLQLFLKRLRKRTTHRVRFFASGEYGEKRGRPHYHALLYGLSVKDDGLIDGCWQKGNTRTYSSTPASIAYVAGYTSKKIGFAHRSRRCIDPETGELLYEWQAPFVTMSRRPGIGANAKQYHQSWRLFGIHNNKRIPVPRFLHAAWKDNATPYEIESLDFEKSQLPRSCVTYESLQAAELLAEHRNEQRASRRTL